jgi:hypothetical protein
VDPPYHRRGRKSKRPATFGTPMKFTLCDARRVGYDKGSPSSLGMLMLATLIAPSFVIFVLARTAGNGIGALA